MSLSLVHTSCECKVNFCDATIVWICTRLAQSILCSCCLAHKPFWGMADTMLQNCKVVVNLCVLTIEICYSVKCAFKATRRLHVNLMTTNMVSVASVAACDARVSRPPIPQKGSYMYSSMLQAIAAREAVHSKLSIQTWLHHLNFVLQSHVNKLLFCCFLRQ